MFYEEKSTSVHRGDSLDIGIAILEDIVDVELDLFFSYLLTYLPSIMKKSEHLTKLSATLSAADSLSMRK